MVAKNTAPAGEELFDSPPPAILFIEGEPIVGTMNRLMVSPAHPQYGKSLIVVIDGISGTYTNKDGELLTIVPGNEYAIWCIKEVLENSVRELKAAKGERIAFRQDAKRASRERRDSSGNPVVYTPYSVSCPDRKKEEAVVTYDNIDEVLKSEDPKF